MYSADFSLFPLVSLVYFFWCSLVWFSEPQLCPLITSFLISEKKYIFPKIFPIPSEVVRDVGYVPGYAVVELYHPAILDGGQFPI